MYSLRVDFHCVSNLGGSHTSPNLPLLRHLHPHMNRIVPPVLHVTIDQPIMLVAVEPGDAQGGAGGGDAQVCSCVAFQCRRHHVEPHTAVADAVPTGIELG